MTESSQRNLLRYFLALIIIFVLIACRIGSFPINPTPPSSSTSFPVQPTEFTFPTVSLGSEVTIPDPQFDETTPETFPEDSIWIQAPENGAKISGILSVQGISDPTFEQNMVIRLVDQNNNEVLRTNTIIQADAGSRGDFSTVIEIPLTSSQPGILQVYSVSPKDGSLVHLSSVSVVINSDNGEGSPSARNERILVNSVKGNGTGTDAMIEVTGEAWGLFENTLNYTVCGERSGNIPDLVCGTMENRLMDGVITTDATEMGLPGEFAISISNIHTFPSSASLVIYSISPMNGSIDHAASHQLFGNE